MFNVVCRSRRVGENGAFGGIRAKLLTFFTHSANVEPPFVSAVSCNVNDGRHYRVLILENCTDVRVWIHVIEVSS